MQSNYDKKFTILAAKILEIKNVQGGGILTSWGGKLRDKYGLLNSLRLLMHVMICYVILSRCKINCLLYKIPYKTKLDAYILPYFARS